jgi:dCTP deaminase
MAQEHDMINPCSEKQVSEGVISYGVSSYGYDLRVAAEFKIFSNVNSTIADPNHFDARSFVTVNAMSRSSRRIRLRWRGRSSTSGFRAMC